MSPRIVFTALCALAAVAPTAARAADAAAFAGPPTRVFVLGTPHLSELPPRVQKEWLPPLLDALAAFRPDVITIEAISGTDCDALERFPSTYPGVAADYCPSRAIAAKATGLDVPAAVAEIQRQLASWPKEPTPAQRRRLAATFAAAGERASALVQWMRLAPEERRAGEGIDDALVTWLEETRARRNENYAIAAELAARLGHERVYAVDDHSADAVLADAGAEFERALTDVRGRPKTFVPAYERRIAALHDGADVLSLYRWLNSAATLRSMTDEDFGAARRHADAGTHGRHYTGWWEVRNLRMVANARAAFATRPGARVLAIVGASHKPPFEAYLAASPDVELVDSRQVLGADEAR